MKKLIVFGLAILTALLMIAIQVFVIVGLCRLAFHLLKPLFM